MATTESASNNTITNADSLELGSTLSGGLTSTDVDYFKVSGDDISVDSLVEIVFTPTIPGVARSGRLIWLMRPGLRFSPVVRKTLPHQPPSVRV